MTDNFRGAVVNAPSDLGNYLGFGAFGDGDPVQGQLSYDTGTFATVPGSPTTASVTPAFPVTLALSVNGVTKAFVLQATSLTVSASRFAFTGASAALNLIGALTVVDPASALVPDSFAQSLEVAHPQAGPSYGYIESTYPYGELVFSMTSVTEPTGLAVLGAALVAIGVIRRERRD